MGVWFVLEEWDCCMQPVKREDMNSVVRWWEDSQ